MPNQFVLAWKNVCNTIIYITDMIALLHYSHPMTGAVGLVETPTYYIYYITLDTDDFRSVYEYLLCVCILQIAIGYW